MRSVVLSAADRAVDALIGVLQGRGYCVIGPRRRDGAIVLEEIHSSADLPAGWTDRQTKATYRLEHTGGPAFFDHAVGPQSARRHLSPPRRSLWSATATDAGFDVAVHVGEQQPRAFIGLRACDLAAISVQDRVLRDGLYGDTAYTAARGSGFFVGVNCGRAVETCFCASMGTGPRVTTGHDLSITEVVDGEVHELIVEVGSERGADVLAEVMRTVPSRDADAADDERVAAMTRAAAAEQVRAVQPRQARRVLTDLEHPRWDDVAERCLSCTNCTLVCPTCFCSAVEDVNSLDGRQTERIQRWDSCFTLGHSELHGAGSVRGDTRARYRQWLTHKLSTWWDQFGESGCVGCGRCITWCPAGIDITEEVAAIGEGAIS